MMLAKAEAGKKSSEGSDNHKKLLKDVETISKVLYPDENSYKNSASTAISQSKSTKIFPLPDPKSKPKASVDDKSVKDKKSIWNWKRLKALSINHSRKFNCCFSIQVHLIEGLPLSFNDASLRVYWKRQDEVMVTHPAKVIQCTAEFEEILNHTCSISGSRSAPHNSAKYEAKHVLLYASVVGAPELDLGKHRVDLARLLPLTLEELEEEKSSGKWTTSFRLSGAARGATMNVSFGYVVVGDNTSASRDNYIAPNALTLRQNSMAALMKSGIKFRQSDGSLPSNTNQYSYQNVDEVKDLHEVLPLSRSKLASSVEALYKKLDEEKTFSPLQNEPKEIEVFTKDCKPIKVDACSLSDSGKAKPEELLGIEGKTCSPMHVKPECEVCEENVETVKLDCYPSPDSGKGNREAEEWESNKGKTHSPIHDKLEFDLLQENAETVKPEGYPSPDSGKEKCEEYEGNGFSVFDQGTELSSNEHIKLEEPIIKALVHAHTVDSTCWIDTSGIRASFEDSDNHDSLDDVNVSSKEKAMVHEFFYKENNICSKEHLLQELESALNTVSDLESVTFDCPDIMEVKSECEMRKSHSLDDFTESVASEFLSMLGIDHSPVGLSSESEPESPRERLLRQFEKDALSEGFSLYDFGTDSDNEDGNHSDASFGSEQWKFSDGIKSPSLLEDLQEGHFIQSRDVKSKIKAQMLQDMEAEALMREWGLNEKSSQHSPPKDSTGYGSLIHLQITEPHILPPLPEELGPFTRTKDGGFLRSMNPFFMTHLRHYACSDCRRLTTIKKAPRTVRQSAVKGRSHANAVAQQALIAHWQSIVKILNNYLKIMKANYVPPFLVHKVFTQIFSFINVQLFNSLLLRRECCSFSNGEYLKTGLAELEQWCVEATAEYTGSAWEELKHIRQAVGFLVMHQKPKKSLNEITLELCPVLSIQQLYRISTMYWDDKYGTHSVSPNVISSMRTMMSEDSNSAVSTSFLLDDDSSIPFSLDDISKSIQEVEVVEVDPPPMMRENSGFGFLLARSE
ncbi:unnamed protein product [Lupinus luteus]|uniref:C2 NT-type domain-containing protein n=1 Tax=Lupinus luteus TaxID=3873 RepID=A0AAV1XUN9_LUPLU